MRENGLVRRESSVFKWNCANFDTFMKMDERQVWKLIIFQLYMTSSIDIQKKIVLLLLLYID